MFIITRYALVSVPYQADGTESPVFAYTAFGEVIIRERPQFMDARGFFPYLFQGCIVYITKRMALPSLTRIHIAVI